MKLLELLESQSVLSEEKNVVYTISAINAVMHMDNTYDEENKQANVSVTLSMKKSKDLSIPSDSQAEYEKNISALQSELAVVSKEFNIRLAKLLKQYYLDNG